MKRKREKFQHVKDLQKSKTQTFNLEVGLASKAWGGLLLSSLNNLMLQSCVWFGLVCQSLCSPPNAMCRLASTSSTIAMIWTSNKFHFLFGSSLVLTLNEGKSQGMRHQFKWIWFIDHRCRSYKCEFLNLLMQGFFSFLCIFYDKNVSVLLKVILKLNSSMDLRTFL